MVFDPEREVSPTFSEKHTEQAGQFARGFVCREFLEWCLWIKKTSCISWYVKYSNYVRSFIYTPLN